MIYLERAYLPDGSATFGRLTLPSGFSCYTLERPWEANRQNVSCIPEGVYSMGLRASAVVRRASGREFSEGWELQDVPGRSLIMMHPGNWVHDTEGCVLTGERMSWDAMYGPTVVESRVTFRALMAELAQRPSWRIDIRAKAAVYP